MIIDPIIEERHFRTARINRDYFNTVHALLKVDPTPISTLLNLTATSPITAKTPLVTAALMGIQPNDEAWRETTDRYQQMLISFKKKYLLN